jgi:hypothetical protein
MKHLARLGLLGLGIVGFAAGAYADRSECMEKAGDNYNSCLQRSEASYWTCVHGGTDADLCLSWFESDNNACYDRYQSALEPCYKEN